MQSFDEVLEEVGEFGPWQLIMSLLLWIPPTMGGVHVLMYSFTGLSPTKGFRCKIPNCDEDDFSFADYPTDIFDRTDDDEFDYCRYKNPTDTLPNGTCTFESTQYTSCPKGAQYSYAPFQFESTLVTELDLVCQEESKVAWIGSAYMFGLMIGSFLCGSLADKYGRKMALLFAIMCSSGGSLAGAFMPEYYSYLVTRIITAIGAQGIFLAPFAMTVEIVGGQKTVGFIPWPVKYKTVVGTMIQAPFAVGMALISLVASYVSDWRTLQWTTSVGTFSQLLVWYFLPESPRWLLAANKTKAAKKVIETGARLNGVKNYTFNTDTSLKEIKEEKGDGESTEKVVEQYGIKTMFVPSLRKISIVLMICWPIVTLGYYGITFSMANLNDDLFISFIISSLVEIPAYVIVLLFMDLWGRKPLFSLSLIASGFICIACGLLEEGTARTTLAMIGKFFASSCFALVYMYTAELYPTTIRSSAVGVCSLMARIGGISAPQIAINLPLVAGAGAPYYVMGGCSVVGGLLALLLPETLGTNLPETVEDVEHIQANSKPIWRCVTSKQN